MRRAGRYLKACNVPRICGACAGQSLMRWASTRFKKRQWKSVEHFDAQRLGVISTSPGAGRAKHASCAYKAAWASDRQSRMTPLAQYSRTDKSIPVATGK